MENPATWTNAHNIIHKILSEEKEHKQHIVYSGSLEFRIISALKNAGLLNEDKLVVTGFKG